MEEIHRQKGWEWFPDLASQEPDPEPKGRVGQLKGRRMYCCEEELVLHIRLAYKMEFFKVMSLLDQVLQLEGQEETCYRPLWDLTALLARYSSEECSAVLENARGSGKSISILVNEPILEEICAHWAIPRLVLI